jgi:hypothetical protein
MAILQTGVKSYDAVQYSSEGQRQADEAAARSAHANGGSFDAYDAAMKALTISHYRRLLAAAQTAGLTEPAACCRDALRDLGTGGV